MNGDPNGIRVGMGYAMAFVGVYQEIVSCPQIFDPTIFKLDAAVAL